MDTRNFNIRLQTDEDGLTGRECPSCEIYFKVKFGTGLETTQSVCPYCGYQGEAKEFFTPDQNAHIQSILAKNVLEPMFREFTDNLKRTETHNGNGFVQIKVSTNIPEFQIHQYEEKVLETNVTCDACGLVFSIYGVFSNCPDCGKLNVRVIFEKSLDASNGKLVLAEYETIDAYLKADLIKNALTDTVSAFDALGKALRKKHTKLPAKPPNLFQNLLKLDEVLSNITGKNISQFLNVTDRDFLLVMFQARHIYEHNAGVIDSEFVEKLPAYSTQLGRKFPLKKDDVSLFIVLMRKLVDAIYNELEK